jgi:hypothetical protein
VRLDHGLALEGRTVLRDWGLALAAGQRTLPSSRTRLIPLGTVSRLGLPESQKPSVSNSVASQGMTVSVLSATG